MLETVFQYRTLLGKCDLGVGLEWEEIEEVTNIESMFEATSKDRRQHRRFRREAVCMTGVLRGDRINDRVDIVELALGGLVIRNAPYVAKGEHVEIVIEDGEQSYRFRAKGVWLKDDGDDYKVGLQLIGMPVRLHTVAISARTSNNVIDKIAA